MVVDGVLEHGGNIGNAGALTTGDVQWMTAGRGIIHRQLAFRHERAHTLQLWVNLPGRRRTRLSSRPASHQARNVDRTRCGRLGGAPDERGLQVAARSAGRGAGNSMTRSGQRQEWS
jgi:redox-sensitive bicupin YhaK (pirin superfamily)